MTLGNLVLQLLWTALGTLPAVLGAILFTRWSSASPRLKSLTCRAALVSVFLVLFAIGFKVRVLPDHDRPEGETHFWLDMLFLTLTVGWLAGASVRIARTWRTRRHVREVCAFACALDPALESQLRQSVDCPAGVALMASEHVASVVIVYGRSPMIVIPSAFLDDSDLAIAVSHELAHLRHRDAAWNLAYEFAAAVLWFSPAILRLGDRMRICQELAADAAAIRRHRCGPGRYGRMLLRFAQVEPPASPFMAAFGGRGDMVERLESLKPVPKWRKLVSLGAFVLVLALFVPLRIGIEPPVFRQVHHSLIDMLPF